MANATQSASLPRNFYLGSYVGTTAAQNIHIGFKPVMIWAWDITSGTTTYLWTQQDLSNVRSIITTAGPASTTAAITQVDNGTVAGFALPASNTTVNANGDTYYFIAFSA